MGIGTTLRRMLGREVLEPGDSTADDVEFEFESKNVNEAAAYQLAYYGAYAYADDEGRDHLVEREFEVYTDGDHTVDGMPLASVREDHSVDGGGGSEHLDGRELELPVEVDPGLEGIALKSKVQAFLERWHRDHVDRR